MEQMRDHCYLRDRALGNASQLQMAPILYKILKDIGNLLGTRHNFWNSPLTKGILSFGSYERHHVPGHVHKLHHYGSYERQHNDVIQDHDQSKSLSRPNHRSSFDHDQSIKICHTFTPRHLLDATRLHNKKHILVEFRTWYFTAPMAQWKHPWGHDKNV